MGASSAAFPSILEAGTVPLALPAAASALGPALVAVAALAVALLVYIRHARASSLDLYSIPEPYTSSLIIGGQGEAAACGSQGGKRGGGTTTTHGLVVAMPPPGREAGRGCVRGMGFWMWVE